MELAPQTIIASRYRVLRELGRGGMGVVYAVEHIHTGEQHAMKLLLGSATAQAEIVERFKREARASSRIKSEHVVKITDADTAPELNGAPYLVMELLIGSDLEKLLTSKGRFEPSEVGRLMSQAAVALDKSHAIGITHRDLKPENLFLHHRENGETMLKIVDFGISKLVDKNIDMAGAGMTRTGAVMGTPLYMSPEQARGLSSLGPPTDIWAMGLIVIHLLTGEIYWRANTVAELMVNILAEPLYPPSTRWSYLPAGIDAWFLRSCERDPARRWPTVGAQIEALRAVFSGVTMMMPAPAAPFVPASSPSHPRITPEPSFGGTNGAVARSDFSPPKTRFPMALLLLPLLVLSGVGFFAYRSHFTSVAAASSTDAPSVSTSASVAPSATTTASTFAMTTLAPITSPSASASSSASANAGAQKPPTQHGTTHTHTTPTSTATQDVAPPPPTATATATTKPTSTGHIMPVAP